MEWKLLWAVRDQQSGHRLFCINRKNKRWAEQTDLVLFHVPPAELSTFFDLETSCIPAWVNWKQKLMSAVATSLRCSQMSRYTSLAFPTRVEICSPSATLCGHGLFTQVRPPGFSPASITRENYLEGVKKKKKSFPKRSNPAFLFSSYFGKTLTSWI